MKPVISSVIGRLDYYPNMPFQGRENHIKIAELAKKGWRYLGNKSKPDDFLVKEYGLVDVQPIILTFAKGNTEEGWVGRAITVKGKKEIKRLATDKLPWIANEVLPPDLVKKYVMTKEATEREDEDRIKRAEAVRFNTGVEIAKNLSIPELESLLVSAKAKIKASYTRPFERKRAEQEVFIITAELHRRSVPVLAKRRHELFKTETMKSQPKISISENAAIHAYYDSHPKKDKLRNKRCAKKHTRCTNTSVGGLRK